MEPLDNEQLDRILPEWSAPCAPSYLESRIFDERRRSRWRWLVTGSVRVPVPVLLAVLIAVAVAAFTSSRRAPGAPALANFEPVKERNIRLIRTHQ
jgi:hypothetical protein